MDKKPPTPKPPASPQPQSQLPAPEIGGYKGPEPTAYGDWQHRGRTTDF
jgi:hypothetical protein